MDLQNQSKHDVFLSYRGGDTRTTSFVDHLYSSLVQHEIKTFKDDADEDNYFCPKSNVLYKNIEESSFYIVIFSKSYASSSWRLDELVKIMECSKENGQLVLPVYYYDFDPLNLRKQGPVFGELFANSEMKKVSSWASVLVEVANLSGIRVIDGRYQATQIKEIVEMVLSKLNTNKLYDNQNARGMKLETLGDTFSSYEQLIGINHRVQKVKQLLKVKPAYKQAWKYDVFMCFEGNDTCKDFVDQLHLALEQHDIYAFRNDQALARVKSVKLEHLKVIEESNIAVVVFSKNFAASVGCLDELVKIMSCNEKIGQSVFPLFYDVDSSDVRHQKGLFGEAFMRNKSEKVELWRKALVKVGTLAGWYLNDTPKRNEATIIESIVDEISRTLYWSSSSVDDNLIGIEAQKEHVISLMKLKSDSVLMTAIWGMGGIGKTTLARAVFDQVSTCFDSSCFVENIREVSEDHGLKHIQRDMLSRLLKDENLHVRSNYEGIDSIRQRLAGYKVLIVLDDVDGKSQLEDLVGSGKWFGEGSRIIITTRDETLLVAHNIIHTYCVKPLDDKESYQFLIRHAFKNDDFRKAYEDLIPEVVSYAGGLPLALKVLSALLCGRSEEEWRSILDRLQVFPEKAIQDTLKISYNSLNAVEKNIFLDIACFFNNNKKDYVVKNLDSRGFSGDNGIRILEQKSLMHISKGNIKMHKLIQQMGRDIARQMHPDKPGKRSRLWQAEEVYEALMDSENNKEINAILLDDMHDYDYDTVDMTALTSMKNLRLLQINSHKKLRFHKESNLSFKKLRWLTWENYPLQSLPERFKANELVGLELRGSSITVPWDGVKFLLRMCFLDLSYSTKLIKTPDFTGTPNLKELKLEYCTSLTEIHESIGSLDRLSLLSFRSCRKLESLPKSFLKLKSLRSLDVSGCLNLKRRRIMDNLLSPSSCAANVILSTPRLQYNLKPQGPFTIHKTIVDMVRHIISEAMERSLKGRNSEEMDEDKKEEIPLLPWKGL